MTMEDTLRILVREEVRSAVREVVATLRPAGESPLMTVREAASFARVAEPTVRSWIQQGKLNRYGTKGALRIKRDELERLLTSRDEPRMTDADLDARADELAKRRR